MIARQLAPAENLGHRAGGLPPPHLELEQPILRGGVALREEQVGLVLRVDVVDAPAVAEDLDRLRQPGNLRAVVAGACAERPRARRRAATTTSNSDNASSSS